MSDKFPALHAKQVVRLLEKLDFVFMRQTGSSHAIYKRMSDHKRTVVPMHGTTIIKRKTLKSIIKDAGLDLEEFKKILLEL